MPPDSDHKIFIAGRLAVDALELCYARAFRRLGHDVKTWDFHEAIRRHAPLGRVGAFINAFWPSDPWLAKANRELLIAVLEAKPDVVIASGYRLMAGTLGQIRSALPDCRIVLIWPDTFQNCHSYTLSALPLYHLVATYSKATIESFQLLGAKRVEWVPLGFDPELHPLDLEPDSTGVFSDCDISFVGNYNPERETAIVGLIDAGFRVKVWGTRESWRQAIDRHAFRRYFQGEPLFGRDFCRAVKSPAMSLNPIALSNYPAANMRFFEIMGCGGVALSSGCPEMEAEFPDGETCFYFSHGRDLIETARRAMELARPRELVARTAQERVRAGHTYVHRARQILSLLANG